MTIVRMDMSSYQYECENVPTAGAQVDPRGGDWRMPVPSLQLVIARGRGSVLPPSLADVDVVHFLARMCDS